MNEFLMLGQTGPLRPDRCERCKWSQTLRSDSTQVRCRRGPPTATEAGAVWPLLWRGEWYGEFALRPDLQEGHLDG